MKTWDMLVSFLFADLSLDVFKVQCKCEPHSGFLQQFVTHDLVPFHSRSALCVVNKPANSLQNLQKCENEASPQEEHVCSLKKK